jgi:hypothetical protein
MHIFCTLFDKNYLYRGLALHSSLVDTGADFELWILCVDETTYRLVGQMHLPHVRLIAYHEFENEALRKVKKERTPREYAWTLASSLCWYMVNKVAVGEMVTYLDADMYFFDNPNVLFDEIGDASIAIVEHRLEGERKKLEKFVGTYNVAWVSFRNDIEGKKASEWWKDRVLEWCGAYFLDGKIGDQHYLNDWKERFERVCVITHEGADVAPWNVENRSITVQNGKIYIGTVPLIFYHFHNFVLVNRDTYLPATVYYIPSEAKKNIYTRYISEMKKMIHKVSTIDPSFGAGFKKIGPKTWIASICFRYKFVDTLYITYSRMTLERTYK